MPGWFTVSVTLMSLYCQTRCHGLNAVDTGASSPSTISAGRANNGSRKARATPEPIKDWSLTSLKEKLIKIGAKVVSHGRYVGGGRHPTTNVPGDSAADRGTNIPALAPGGGVGLPEGPPESASGLALAFVSDNS